ncbi:MAG: hypothetical protein JO232_03150 [Verrucomicrobia bacterium]|nr:hypothetical protein [Verrucomicrobiota bacterium]
MRSLLTFLCLLAIVSPLRADDEEMSRLLVGTWRTSFDQPLYNNSIAKVQITVTYAEDGQYAMDSLMGFSTGGGGLTHTAGNWEINNGILTTTVQYWTPRQLPKPIWDDGPSALINFSSRNLHRVHGVNWSRIQ